MATDKSRIDEEFHPLVDDLDYLADQLQHLLNLYVNEWNPKLQDAIPKSEETHDRLVSDNTAAVDTQLTSAMEFIEDSTTYLRGALEELELLSDPDYVLRKAAEELANTIGPESV